MIDKILVIGPSSTHVSRYIDLVAGLCNEIIYVGEAPIVNPNIKTTHLINFRSINPLHIISNSKKLKRIILDEKASVIHIHQINRVAFFAARILSKLKTKFVVTAWGSDVLVIPNQNAIFKKMTQKVLNTAACITADSNEMIDSIKTLSNNKNVELVYFGVDPIAALPKEKIIFSNRALFKLYQIDAVIKEFASFVKTASDWKLIIGGKGEELQNLKSLVKDLALEDKVEFVGWLSREDNISYYQRATIYVSLPTSDGTSVSLLEAMSAGCIPVLSDLTVSYEWIENKKNGIIKCDNENAFVSALNLDLNKAQTINSKIIVTKATGQITTKMFESIYQNL